MSTYLPNPFNDAGFVEKYDTCATFYSGPGGRDVQSVTYVDLFETAAGLVEHLTEMGFIPGDRLLLVYTTSPDFLVALVACRMGGFVAVPSSPPSGTHYSERVSRIVKDCDALGVLTSGTSWPNGEEVVASLAATPAIRNVIDTDLVGRRATPPDVPPLMSAPDTPVLIQYTSGSTGRPKGVVVTSGSLAHNLRHQHDQMHAGLEGPNVSWLPFHHDMGLFGGVLQTLHWGAHTVFLPPLLFVQKPHLWLDLIGRHKAVRSGGPNFAFQRCVDVIRDEQLANVDLSSWRIAFCGAEPVRARTMQAFCDRFAPCGFDPGALMPCYGMAEATLYVSARPAGRGLSVDRFDRDSLQPGQVARRPEPGSSGVEIVSCGRPPAALDVRILCPNTKQPQPEGSVGEIWVGGPSIAAGYWRNDLATQQNFRAQIGGAGRHYLRTGDMGFVRDGEVYVTGRLKEMIIVRGRNFFPTDIEAMLERDFRCLEPAHVCAVGHPDESGNEAISIFAEVKRSEMRNLDTEALARAVSATVSREIMVSPESVRFLRRGTLPKTTSGKIRRTAIYDLWRNGSLQDISADPVGRSVLADRSAAASKDAA